MRPVLLFGASGFIGAHVRAALEPHAPLVCPGRDRCDLLTAGAGELAARLRATGAGTVVNCTGSLDGSVADLVSAHTMVTAKLIDAIERVDPNIRLVRLGSAGEYGPVPHGRAATEDGPAAPVSELLTALRGGGVFLADVTGVVVPRIRVDLALLDRRTLLTAFVQGLYDNILGRPVDPASELDHSRNVTGRLINWLVLNNGFHTAHHLRPALHWSLLPELHRTRVAPGIRPGLSDRSLMVAIWRQFVAPAAPR